jgi:hypothetical protein
LNESTADARLAQKNARQSRLHHGRPGG